MAQQNAGSIVYTVDLDTAGLISGSRQVDSLLNSMNGSLSRLDASASRTERSLSSMESTMSALSGVAKGLMAALSVSQVAEWGNEWVTVNNKLTNSVKATEQLADVTQRVFDISQDTRSSISATATLYARLERATRSAGTSTQDLISLTETINKGLAVSGATTEEASSAMIQLSQALASGVLRGEEFNSITENGSRLAVALSDSLGVTIGQLRTMAAAGQLTTDVVVSGLLQQGDKIAKEFANTTQTIGQAISVATNNITKFVGESTTVSTGIKAFNSGIISLSQNLEAVSAIIIALTAITGSRFAGALAAATAAKVKDSAATITSAKASAEAAKDAELEASAVLRLATVEKDAAIQTLRLTEARLESLRATNASSVSEVKLADAETASIRTTIALIESEKTLESQRMRAQITEKGRIATATRMAELQQASATLNTRLAAAEAASEQARATAITSAEASVSSARLAAADATGVATAANGRYIASQEASVVATRAASISIGVLKGALSLIGGPAGVAMLAAAAVFYFWQQAQQAKKEAIAFADGLDRLNSSLTSMSNIQLRGTIADANTSIRAQKENIADLQTEVDKLTTRYQNFTPEAKKYADSMGQGTGYAQTQAQVTDELAQKTRDLQNAKDKLAKTEDTASEATRTLTNNMLTSMGVHDSLIEKGTTLERIQGAVAKSFGDTADEINRANQAGKQFNPNALKISPATSKGDEVISSLEAQNELLKIQDERQRAVVKGRMQAAKVTSNQNQIDSAGRLAGENFDLEKAEERRKDALQDSERQGKKAASTAESIAQKLEQLKQKSEVSADSTQQLSRDQSILAAQQSLGNGATKEQIALAGQYAAKIYDNAEALKAQQKAEKERQETEKSYKQVQSSASPISALDNQFQEQITALNAYAAMYPQKIEEVEALRASIEDKYRQQREAAMWQEFSQMNAGTQAIAAAMDSLGSTASNAITGIITGTTDLNDALRSVGMTVLNSVINSFVQMGVEWAKSAIMGAMGMSTASAATMAQGAAIAAAMAPAAAMTSLATAGANSVPAQAGISATVGLAQGLSVAGARYNGGTVSGNGLYQVGEKGKPEIFKASNGNQYMIPGDNGSVISNRAMNGGSNGNVPIVNNYVINQSSGAQATTTSSTDGNGNVTIQTIISDIEEGGPISQSISRNFSTNRRATE